MDVDPLDEVLRARLSDLERSLPAGQLAPDRRGRGLALPTALALLLIGVAAGAAGATALDAVRVSPGVFSPGGALACSKVVEMAPPRAGEILGQLGYNLSWQVEDRDAGTSIIAPGPPPSGYIQGGVLQGRDLLIVVETGETATPTGPSC